MHLARLGCLLAFALPFVGGGLAALVSAGARIASGQREGEAVVAGSVGLLFTLAGGGLLALGVHGSRRQREADRLRAAHPAEPWRWRPDWAAGRVTDSSRAGLAIAWGFAGFWNLLSWPAVAAALTETDGPPLLLIALFPLVGLGLLVWAGRLTIRYRTFGTSVLEFGDMPGVIGRGFRGVVRVQGSPPAPRFDALLRRIERRTSGSGRSRTTTESIAWEERTAVTPRREAGGVVVPVAFRIPASEPPTDADPSANPRTLWRLELAADVPGVDYHARFDVPVFEVPGSAPLDDASLPPLPDAPSPAAYRQPRESPITLSTTARGTEIFFPRARNPGMAAALTGFAALWWGIVAVLLRIAAPLLFPVVFGAFGVVLAAAAVQLWFGVTRVEVARDRVVVSRGILAARRAREVPRSEVASVEVKIGMQGGSAPSYDVRIVRRDGKRIAAGSGIRDKREAEWLAWTIEQGLGLGAERPAGHML